MNGSAAIRLRIALSALWLCGTIRDLNGLSLETSSVTDRFAAMLVVFTIHP